MGSSVSDPSHHLKTGGGWGSTCPGTYRHVPPSVPVPVGGNLGLRPFLEAVPHVVLPVSVCLSRLRPLRLPVPPTLVFRLPLAWRVPDRQLRSCATTLQDGVSTGLSLHHRVACLSILLNNSLTNYVGCIILVHHLESLPMLPTPFHQFFGGNKLSFTTISSSLHHLSRFRSSRVLRFLRHSNETF